MNYNDQFAQDYAQYAQCQLNTSAMGAITSQSLAAAIQSAAIQQESKKMPDGTKPVVICRGSVEEAKDMDAAQALAESKAHQMSADAYILKPIRRVAPKRDVVTTDLA